jgi:hypothetical protein
VSSVSLRVASSVPSMGWSPIWLPNTVDLVRLILVGAGGVGGQYLRCRGIINLGVGVVLV